MADNISVHHPDVNFVRPCNLCPHMKRITLPKIRSALEDDALRGDDRSGDRGAGPRGRSNGCWKSDNRSPVPSPARGSSRDASGEGEGAARTAPTAAIKGTMRMTPAPLPAIMVEPSVRAALLEDLGRAGDLTTDAIVPAGARAPRPRWWHARPASWLAWILPAPLSG